MIIERKHPCKHCGAVELYLCHYKRLCFHLYQVECSRCHCLTKPGLSWKGAVRRWRKEMSRNA